MRVDRTGTTRPYVADSPRAALPFLNLPAKQVLGFSQWPVVAMRLWPGELLSDGATVAGQGAESRIGFVRLAVCAETGGSCSTTRD